MPPRLNDDLVYYDHLCHGRLCCLALYVTVEIDPITSPFEGRFSAILISVMTLITLTLSTSFVFAAFKSVCLGSRESTILRRVPRVESFRPQDMV